MTKITANIILIIMAGTWAYLSVSKGDLVPITQNFIILSGILVGGDIAEKFKKPK
jgi:hypothetical protein